MKEILKKAEKLGCVIPHKKWDEIDRGVMPVLRAMEEVGVKVDVNLLRKLSKKLKVKSEKLQKEIFKQAGEEFNLSSPLQLSDILFKKLKLPTGDIRKIKSGISTSASELSKLKDKSPIIGKILEYRELSKLISTYLAPLPKMVDENSRLHSHFGQDTRTSRLTSSDPNLQNIPIKGDFGPQIRAAFIAEKGNVLVSADYSQIELRVVACLSGDEKMLEAFSEGVDIHARTASELFRVPVEKVNHDQRRLAKTVNFGVLYGISPFGLSQALGIGQDTAAEYIRRYFETHIGVKRYCDDQVAFARKNGYIETLFGFKRELKNINSNIRSLAESEERMAINTPVQGTAAEILKLSMIELHRKLNQKSKIQNPKSKYQNNLAIQPFNNKAVLLLTVHDELLVETPKKEAKNVAKLMKEIMESTVKLCVPVEVEVGIGRNWNEAKNNTNL